MMLAAEIEDRANLEAGIDVLQIDEKLRQAGVALLALVTGAAKQDHVMRAMRIRGPHFRAVDEKPALHGACARAHRREIRAGIRLTHADAEIALAGGDARQNVVFLLVGADAQEQRSALPVGDPMAADGSAGGQHFLEHHVALKRGALMSTVTLRPSHADPAARAHLAAELGIEAAPGTSALLRRAIGNLTTEKGADFAAQGLGLRRLRRACETQRMHGRAFVGARRDEA